MGRLIAQYRSSPVLPQMLKASKALDRMQDKMEAADEGWTLSSIFRFFGFGK